MRPERLALSAFGPFAAEQDFDFAELGRHRLFLIHGPTGAGKTTLLDALCFALFGESSGDERQAEHLRSHHAAATTPTWVELDFALGPERYRIRRAPSQPRPGRGGRIVTVAPAVTLWRREGDQLVVLADQERRARDEVRRLLGYAQEEFRQVVVLPQGRFRELLTAKADARQAILATLFGTRLYERIERQLAARARLALDEAKRVEEQRRTLLAEAGAATPEAAAVLVAELATRLDEATRELAPSRIAAERAAADAARGRQTERALQRAAETARALATLLTREPAVREDRARLASARRAADTLTADRLHARLRQQADRARAAAAEARAAERAAEARSGRAAEHMRDAAERVARIEAGRTEAARLDALARAARAAEEAEALATGRQTRLAAARSAHADAEAAAVAAGARLDDATRARDAATRLAATADMARAALIRARDLAGDLTAAGTLAARIATLTAEHATARDALEVASRTLRDAERARTAAEAALRARHAVDLARHLVPGAPCPVCGGRDHPAPARPTGADLADLDAAAAAEAGARAGHAAAEAAAHAIATDLLVARDRLDGLRPRLPDGVDAATAARRVSQAQAEADAATQAERAVPALTEAQARAAAKRDATARAAEKAGDAVREEERELENLRGRIAARRADAPVEAGTSAALRDAAAAVAADTAAAAAALEADRAEQSAASAALTGAREHAARDAERARTEEDDAARALADWLDACRAAGFADGEAARAAWLPPERVAELDASIMAFDRELAGARAVAAQAGEAAAGLIPPDLAALDAADAAARAAEQAAAELAARLRERHEQAAARVDAIVRADAALTAARQRHDLLRDIAGTAAGTIGKRLSLMGFVLTTILDEALAAANEHLSRMLGGRYRVRRREEPARGNATIGLDIEVLDEWTGQERPAGTLSGGEGFCAALALALGLADTVQAHAGARRIDTLFIDEGFGALDPDALDTAMDVLDGLQAGDRLVGIISHVAELRARIPAQLLVRPGARGSLAGFVTGR